MAPTAPTKRRTLREKLAAARASGPYEPRKAPRPDAVAPTSDGFSNTKKDKRQIKHASFVSRIEKVPSGKTLKRRRPGKKLKTTLEGLADALPDLRDETDVERALSQQLREGKVRHKSLRSRPGALKRREKVVKGEVERFGVSLARLNAVGAAAAGAGTEAQGGMQVENGDTGARTTTTTTTTTAQQPQQPQTTGSTSNRWAALRGFISATMEQNPAFIGKHQDGM